MDIIALAVSFMRVGHGNTPATLIVGYAIQSDHVIPLKRIW